MCVGGGGHIGWSQLQIHRGQIKGNCRLLAKQWWWVYGIRIWTGYLNVNFFAETRNWRSCSVIRHQQRGFHDFFLCDTWGHWGVSSRDQWDTWGKNPTCTRVRALCSSDCPWWGQPNGVHEEPGNESCEAHNEDLCMFSHLDSFCPELITTLVKTLICPLKT